MAIMSVCRLFIMRQAFMVVVYVIFVAQTQQITPQLALQVLLQFDKAINTALANRVRNRVNFKVSIDSDSASAARVILNRLCCSGFDVPFLLNPPPPPRAR